MPFTTNLCYILLVGGLLFGVLLLSTAGKARHIMGASADGGRRWGKWCVGLALFFVPSVAWADDGGATTAVYGVLGVFALQVIGNQVNNHLQRTRAAADRGQDQQYANLKTQVDAMGGQIAALVGQLQTTREEYARRVDTEKAVRELRNEIQEDLKEHRAEMKEIRNDVKLIETNLGKVQVDVGGMRADMEKILNLLAPKAK